MGFSHEGGFQILTRPSRFVLGIILNSQRLIDSASAGLPIYLGRLSMVETSRVLGVSNNSVVLQGAIKTAATGENVHSFGGHSS